MKPARLGAYATILAACIPTFAATDKDWWFFFIPFLAVLFLEVVFYGWSVINFVTQKWQDSVIASAASRAAEIIEDKGRSDAAAEVIAELEGAFDPQLVEAAKRRRLRVEVTDE